MADNTVHVLAQTFEKLQNEDGSFQDPVYHFKDPRPTAEICKGFLYLGKIEAAKKGFEWLIKQQQDNGSWLEVLPNNFAEESCVSTPIIARILTMAYKKLKIKAYKQAAEKAYIYLKSKEFLPGYYIKSFYHYSDTLNVNASVAAFFEELSTINKDPELCAARDRAIFNVVRYQFKDGAYPYASPVRTFPYEHHLNYRCPHYHAITLYFLLLADKLQKNEYFKRSLPKAVKWMQQSLKSGKIKWIVGKHLFSLGVTGAYGYMYYCFSHLNNIEYMQLIEKRLNFLIKKRLVNRFEPFNFFEMIAVILKELVPLETISPTGFPLVLRLRRIKTILARYLKERVKIVESLYYSAQIFDCLTEMEATN